MMKTTYNVVDATGKVLASFTNYQDAVYAYNFWRTAVAIKNGKTVLASR
jgi:hypothetical protein